MKDRIALVTGGGTGIGRAAALALARESWLVVVAGRRSKPLEATVALGAAFQARMLAVSVDVCQPASVQALFGCVKDSFGRLDLLFNNAGIDSPAIALEDVTYQLWSEVIATNLTGVFLCTQEAFRIMKAQHPRGGRIINNGSIAAHVPRPLSAPYTATKHAVAGLTKATSLDGREYDIACGQIDIGNAATDLLDREALHGMLQPDGALLVEPRLDVEHVARAVAYMASLPLEANVQFMTVMATTMPFIGRG